MTDAESAGACPECGGTAFHMPDCLRRAEPLPFEPHGWTHTMCVQCWLARKPGREPVRMPDAEPEPCCYCGESTDAGIYVRHEAAEARFCPDNVAPKE